MGMYDRVIIEYPVEGLPEGMQFQTHSLDCGMQEYTITKDGRLMLEHVRYEWPSDATRQESPEKTRHVIAREDQAYHGDLYIHAKGGLEFRLRFTDGVVTQVKKLGGE